MADRAPRRPSFLAALLAISVLALVACSNEDGDSDESSAEPTAGPESTVAGGEREDDGPGDGEETGPVLEVDGTTLPPPPENGRYLLWLDSGTGEGADLLGSVEGGEVTRLPIGEDQLTGVLVLSVDAGDGGDPVTSPVALAGQLGDDSAQLRVDHPEAIGHDFGEAAGGYILATPTNGSGTDERSGIWWTDVPRAQSLFLPELPGTWTYEGWLAVDGVALTTGTFRDPFAADDSAPYSGPEPAPPLVGEDLIVNAPEGVTFPVDLRGMGVVISVEPVPDPDPAPSGLVVLAGDVPADAADHVRYEVENVSSTLPAVDVTVTGG
jgi:hypothetical protein